MPIQTTWYIEDHVLYYDVTGQVDFEDIQRLADDYTQLASQSHHPIHSIADLQNLENLKASMKDISRLRNVKTFGGWTLVIRRQESVFSKVILLFIKLAEQIFGMHLAIVGNMEEAEQFLREKDPTLNSLPGS